MNDRIEIFHAVAAAVDEQRHWQRLMEMAKVGATPRGGVTRLALSPEDREARALLARWGEEIDCELFVDPIGNMFLRRPGSDPDALPVVSGSHLDSQPKGGRFDGTYGVLAALEVVHALADAGVQTRRPIEAVAWTNEEGSRFMPATMGSTAYTEPSSLERMLAARDGEGTPVADALAETLAALPEAGARELGAPFHAYVEAHIEQGPVLEERGKLIGVVEGIQAGCKLVVEVEGRQDHAGTTPRRRRKDALLAAVAMVQAIDRMAHDPEDVLRCTFGRFELQASSPSLVPGHVTFSVDLRHPDDELLKDRAERVAPLCHALAGPCEVVVTEPQRGATVRFEGIAVDAVRSAVDRLGLPAMELFSGAGHDARHLPKLCPSAMIFVPCERGISHSEDEKVKPEHLAAGTRVLAHALVELAELA